MKLNVWTLFGSAALTALVAVCPAPAAEPGFKPLFNEKDLSGWEGNPELWSVRDGAITGVTKPDPADPKKSLLKHNTFLIYQGGEFSDFELRFSYRIVGGNSGIQYRSKVLRQGGQGPVVGGYQADFEAGPKFSGILYDEAGVAGNRGIMAMRGEKVVWTTDCKKTVTGSLGTAEEIQARIKPDQWNDYVIIARGNHLQHFVNGTQTVDVTDQCESMRLKAGVLALQIHAGPPMTVQFRNIRLQNLAAARADLERLQGSWRPTQIVANGNPAEADALDRLTVTIQGNRYLVVKPDSEESGQFHLDEAHQPAWMDVTTPSGDYVPAIYELTGDTLRVCYAINGAPRPTAFESTAGSDRVFAVYQRIDR
jgi:uncharacterized protein (TIGR03067 family)